MSSMTFRAFVCSFSIILLALAVNQFSLVHHTQSSDVSISVNNSNTTFERIHLYNNQSGTNATITNPANVVNTSVPFLASCNDVSMCSSSIFSGCEWKCGGECTITSKNQCGFTCTPDSCSLDECKRCTMCRKKFQSNGKSCPIATFKDETSVKFSIAPDYWLNWTRAGRPYICRRPTTAPHSQTS